MQPTRFLLRGSRGVGWYNAYRADPEVFIKYTKPTPFDWSKDNIKRPKARFEVSCKGDSWGSLVFELAEDVVPKLVKNFKLLTTGDNVNKFTYKGTKIHKIRKGDFIMCGDVEGTTGDMSHSAYEQRFLPDENFIIPHCGRGILSMASVGVNTIGSQFYVTLSPAYYMNGRCSPIGRLVQGDDVLQRIEKVYTYNLEASEDIVFSNCEIIEPAASS